MSISLHELADRIGDNPDMETMMALGNEYFDFVKAIDARAVSVLKGLSRKDANVAITLIQAVAIAQAMQEGNIDIRSVGFLMSDEFSRIVAIIFKLSVGIAVVEELR